jgi:hypothetical protein
MYGQSYPISNTCILYTTVNQYEETNLPLHRVINCLIQETFVYKHPIINKFKSFMQIWRTCFYQLNNHI